MANCSVTPGLPLPRLDRNYAGLSDREAVRHAPYLVLWHEGAAGRRYRTWISSYTFTYLAASDIFFPELASRQRGAR